MNKDKEFRVETSGFSGRQKELEELGRVLDQVQRSNSDGNEGNESGNRAIFIKGPSGIGKSRLVEAFLTRQSKNGPAEGIESHPIRWVRAKFEAGASSVAVPFAIIGFLIQELLGPILDDAENQLCQEVCIRLKEEKADLKRIIPLAPGLADRLESLILQENNTPHEKSEVPNETNSSAESSMELSAELSMEMPVELSKRKAPTRFGMRRSVAAWKAIVRLLSEYYCIVLVLDDLQWMDQTSLEFLIAIAEDTQINHLLLLATLRNFDGRPSRTLEAAYKNRATNMDLPPLSTQDVDELLVCMIPGLRHADTSPLSQLLVRKTNGNPFFLRTILQDICANKLIYFDAHAESWKWEFDKIQAKTSISDNVLELVSSRLTALDETVQQVLALAAFLGSTYFDVDVLAVGLKVMAGAACSQNFDGEEKSHEEDFFVPPEDIEARLSKALQDGYVEKVSIQYKFSHDRIRESVQPLLAVSDKDSFHVAVGKELLAKYRLQQRNFVDGMETDPGCSPLNRIADNTSLLFTAARHFKAGVESIAEADRVEIVDALAEASQVALSKSSFYMASDLLQAAAPLLDRSNGWETFYDQTLKVKTDLAKVSYCCGRHEVASETIRDVTSNAREIEDCVDAYQVSMQMMEQQGNGKGAVDEAVKVLEQLGVRFPKSNLMGRSLKMLWRLRNTKPTMADIERIGSAKNLRRDTALGFLLELCRVSMGNASQGFTLYALLLSAQMALKEGSARYGGAALMGLAHAFSFMGDISTAARFGKLGEELSARNTEYPIDQALVLSGGNYFVLHWIRPFSQCSETQFFSATVLMESDRVDVGLLTLAGYCQLYFCAGLNLVHLKRDAQRALRTANDCHLDEYKLHFFGLLLFLSPLTGDKPDIVEEAAVFNEWAARGNSPQKRRELSYKFIIAYMFGNIQEARHYEKELLKEKGDPSPLSIFVVFFQGLLGYAGSCPAWKQRRKADRALATLEKYCKLGNKNTLNMLLLLKAERLASKKRSDEKEVREAFDKAIRSAGREGVTSIQALANERSGVFHSGIGADSWATTYFSRAYELYESWGAYGKMEHMKAEYKGRFEPPHQGRFTVKSGIRARQRISQYLDLSEGQRRSLEFRFPSHSKLGAE